MGQHKKQSRTHKQAKAVHQSTVPPSAFLPMTREAVEERGWSELDFVYISGDAYVDHPSFGPAIITRVLESHGYKVGIIAQPDWNDPASVAALGEPRLAFLVSSGNMDSMVNHYTAAKKPRSTDAYSPGGVEGKRPNHAAVVYSNLIRRTFKKTPIVLGGIEASLRRLAHYDYWSNSLKRSILLDAGADLISYGMGERSIVEIADALNAGIPVQDITFIDGTVYKTRSLDHVVDYIELPSWEEVSHSKEAFAKSFAEQYRASDPITGKRLVEAYPHKVYVVQNPPALPLSTSEMDAVYRLPFTRTWHPMYDAAGGIPALDEIKFSLTSCRGCFGECSFCALTFHQGRIVSARSHESLLEEARLMTQDPEFKGYINDVGGPTANFRAPACDKQLKAGACTNKRCLGTKPCKALKASHTDYVKLLRELRDLPQVKKVFVRSGIRFDYVLADPDKKHTFMKELVNHHVSGQLRVAPEHVSDEVLAAMGKPPRAVYDEFVQLFDDINREADKKQFVVPYLMSSHPGSTLKDAIELAEYVRDMGFNPEQVQDFYPTPSTVSTCMYYTGLDPLTMQPIYVPRSAHEKALQRALIQYRNPANYDLVREALQKAGRTDLIGWDEKCLIRPVRPKRSASSSSEKSGAGRGSRAAQGAGGSKGAGAAKGSRALRCEKGRSLAGVRGKEAGKPAGKGVSKGSSFAPSTKAQTHKGRPPKANGRKGGIRKGR